MQRRRPRIHYTEQQKALMWERWKKGETLHQIAKLFDRPHTSIRGVLAATGGIRPPERCRSRLALTLAEREEISRGLVAGDSIRAVAARLSRFRTHKCLATAISSEWRPSADTPQTS